MTAGRAVARIDLGAVEHNCRHLAAQLDGGAELCAVVKADGYGHGADDCATAALEGGAVRLAVATAGEAEKIGRRFHHVPLLTMGALTVDELEVCLNAGSEVAVWRPEFLHEVVARAQAQGRPARVHVKHDSGMGRLGTADTDEVEQLARTCDQDPNLELAGVWTHFATADERDDDYFGEQLARFTPLAKRLKAASIAPTGASFRQRASTAAWRFDALWPARA